jgi:hypothetical protein
MDKILHTTYYADDTNTIVTSTNNNDLQKEANLTLQLTCEWFQINQLVLNENKTLVIKFSLAKTLTYTLSIILHNQHLTLTESNKFLGMHSDSNLSWTLHTEKLL